MIPNARERLVGLTRILSCRISPDQIVPYSSTFADRHSVRCPLSNRCGLVRRSGTSIFYPGACSPVMRREVSSDICGTGSGRMVLWMVAVCLVESVLGGSGGLFTACPFPSCASSHARGRARSVSYKSWPMPHSRFHTPWPPSSWAGTKPARTTLVAELSLLGDDH